MKKRTWIAVAAAWMLVLVYAVFLRPSEEDRIRRQLGALSEAVRVGPGDQNPVVRAARIQKAFGRILAPRVRVDVPELGEPSQDRDALAGVAMSVGGGLGSLEVGFDRVRVEIDRTGQKADVIAGVVVNAVELDGQAHREGREVTLRLDKIEGEWRITAAAARGGGG
jgi:hypothetical protein